MALLKNEKKYEFRQRMRVLHRKDVRDFSLKAQSDEIAIENGWSLVLPDGYGEVVFTACQDFADYMLVSMKVSVLLCDSTYAAEKRIQLKLNNVQNEDYIINIEENITITGKNERGLAQALYCLEDKMNIAKAPYLKKEEIRHTFLYSPRMVHSGYGLDSYPNEHLQAIAHSGMDAILVFVKGINHTPSGFLDFNELITRAAKYGIDVYAYSYLKSELHPSDENAQEFYDKLYGSIFEACPGLRGVVLVGESVGFPSHDNHVTPRNARRSEDNIPYCEPLPGFWPCYDYPEWIDCVKKAVRKHKEDADIVFWTYNWGYVEEEARIKLINTLPTDISLLVTYEMFESYNLGSFKQTVADYSLAFSGPGRYFTSEAKAAKERGIRLYAMTNTGGLTWDIGTIPYEPMPYQWMDRYEGMRQASENYGLCGLMESHHFGFWPSFISDLAKQCFIKENKSMEESLIEILKAHFDKGNEEKINEALKLWSEAIRCYTPSDADQYGAFRCGPSYPFCLIKEIKPLSESFAHFGNRILEVIYPADYSATNNIPCGRGMLPSLRLDGEIESLSKMLQYMKSGLDILKEIKMPNEELLYLINLGEYICCCIVTGINAKKWFKMTSELKLTSDRKRVTELIGEMKELLKYERENAEKAIPIVLKDSRLGWEPSMDYIADAEHIRWKLKHMDYVLDYEIKCYEKGSAEKWFN